MKILICAEFFHPSVGGVQEVVKQIAIRLAHKGHEITLATTALPERTLFEYAGIRIVGFNAGGNDISGLYGEVEAYRKFVQAGEFDAILIYAAQQWSLDALLNILPMISCRKVLVPCGFSGLYRQEYKNYFKRLASDLSFFDFLIFHSFRYRDYAFAQSSGLDERCCLIPNGADKAEFEKRPESKNFRQNYGISASATILFTVGSLNGLKGHLEIAQALSLLETDDEIILILNGNQISRPPIRQSLGSVIHRLRHVSFSQLLELTKKVFSRVFEKAGLRDSYYMRLKKLVTDINDGRYGKKKRILITDLDREALIQCYFESDLFVFASHIEYSPLVLFEACAAGLPFLSVPVGNAAEIAAWTGGGKICPASVDGNGYTHVEPPVLANAIHQLIADQNMLDEMGRKGRKSWLGHFNWDVLADDYEAVLSGHLLAVRNFEDNSLE